jgi:hypothetical protein
MGFVPWLLYDGFRLGRPAIPTLILVKQRPLGLEETQYHGREQPPLTVIKAVGASSPAGWDLIVFPTEGGPAMRPLAVTSIVAAFAWAGVSLAVVTQDPEVAILAPADCPGAEAWRQSLAQAFNTEPATAAEIAGHRDRAGLPPALAGCQAARVGGYLIEGPVPADTIAALLRDHPRGVTAIAVDAAGSAILALGRDGTVSPLAEVLDDD